jgi:hypothetical protein
VQYAKGDHIAMPSEQLLRSFYAIPVMLSEKPCLATFTPESLGDKVVKTGFSDSHKNEV